LSLLSLDSPGIAQDREIAAGGPQRTDRSGFTIRGS
jgi:hypothetical protein